MATEVSGDGAFVPPIGVIGARPTPWSVVAGDFNGDGKLDLATANRESSKYQNGAIYYRSNP